VRAAALALLVASQAAGQDSPAPAPTSESVLAARLTTCSALWEGYADVLGDEGERELALRFRNEAARLTDATAARSAVSERRPWMVNLLHAYLESRDRQSRGLFERLLTDCARLEADLPPP
jgi:hypothetical protein